MAKLNRKPPLAYESTKKIRRCDAELENTPSGNNNWVNRKFCSVYDSTIFFLIKLCFYLAVKMNRKESSYVSSMILFPIV